LPAQPKSSTSLVNEALLTEGFFVSARRAAQAKKSPAARANFNNFDNFKKLNPLKINKNSYKTS
jgi:hypothetical protein